MKRWHIHKGHRRTPLDVLEVQYSITHYLNLYRFPWIDSQGNICWTVFMTTKQYLDWLEDTNENLVY